MAEQPTQPPTDKRHSGPPCRQVQQCPSLRTRQGEGLGGRKVTPEEHEVLDRNALE